MRATRRASSTASREQHLFWTTRSTPSSSASMTPGSDQRRNMIPITSCPCSFSSAAATELSTPPLIATTMRAMLSAPISLSRMLFLQCVFLISLWFYKKGLATDGLVRCSRVYLSIEECEMLCVLPCIANIKVAQYGHLVNSYLSLNGVLP